MPKWIIRVVQEYECDEESADDVIRICDQLARREAHGLTYRDGRSCVARAVDVEAAEEASARVCRGGGNG